MLPDTVKEMDKHIQLLIHMRDQSEQEGQTCRMTMLMYKDRPEVLSTLQEQVVAYLQAEKRLNKQIRALYHKRERIVSHSADLLMTHPTLPEL